MGNSESQRVFVDQGIDPLWQAFFRPQQDHRFSSHPLPHQLAGWLRDGSRGWRLARSGSPETVRIEQPGVRALPLLCGLRCARLARRKSPSVVLRFYRLPEPGLIPWLRCCLPADAVIECSSRAMAQWFRRAGCSTRTPFSRVSLRPFFSIEQARQCRDSPTPPLADAPGNPRLSANDPDDPAVTLLSLVGPNSQWFRSTVQVAAMLYHALPSLRLTVVGPVTQAVRERVHRYEQYWKTPGMIHLVDEPLVASVNSPFPAESRWLRELATADLVLAVAPELTDPIRLAWTAIHRHPLVVSAGQADEWLDQIDPSWCVRSTATDTQAMAMSARRLLDQRTLPTATATA